MPNCKALTKAGALCRAKVGPNGTCYLHDSPERARLLGQIGGQKNRQQLPEPPTGPFTLTDLRNTLATTIRGVQSKTITPRAAGAIAQLSNSMKSMLVADELERRVAALEQQLAEQHRAAAYASEAETAATYEEAAEQLMEEQVSSSPDAGQPVEGTEDGIEDRGERIAEEEED